MSMSIHSETSKDEIETEDTELEDLVWNLMSRSGLLPQIQGQIAKFIEDNGKAENVHIFPERADRKILGLIFEYLQWIGLKQTNSVLLSETPVDIDLSFIKSSTADPDYRPELFRILEDHNETEDRGTPTRSHNYSKDEFEDSRLTSGSGRQSVNRSVSVDDVENVASEGDEENQNEASSHGVSRAFGAGGSNLQQSASLEQNKGDQTPVAVKPLSRGFEMGDNSSNDLLINFDSPVTPAGRSFDIQRPNVTVRQRFDLPEFPSPGAGSRVEGAEGQLSKTFTIPHMSSDIGQSFVSAATNLFKIPEGRKDEEPVGGQSQEGLHKDINHNPEHVTGNLNSSARRRSGKDPLPMATSPPPEDESTSDFMETLTIEEDTQDVSLPTDDKGMSSCEHIVSLH